MHTTNTLLIHCVIHKQDNRKYQTSASVLPPGESLSLAKTIFGDHIGHTCLRCTSARSGLEALRNALYKFSTYLLTLQYTPAGVAFAWPIKMFKHDVIHQTGST